MKVVISNFFQCYQILAPGKYFVNDVSKSGPCLVLSIQAMTIEQARYFEGRMEKVYRSLSSSLSSDFKA